MSPPANAAVRRQSPQRLPDRQAEPRRHVLRLVERPVRRRRRLARKLAALAVVTSLVTVVIAHAVVAEEQVRLSIAETQLTAEQSAHRQDVLDLAQRETPGRVVSQAEALHLAAPSRIVQLPYVPLNVPLATPAVAPGPAGTAAATPAPAAGSPPGR